MNTVRDLHAAACQAFERAYAPYSGFKVGAAVLDDCGHISRGCNVENVSYPPAAPVPKPALLPQ